MKRWPWIVGGVVILATIVLGLVLANRFGTDPNLASSPLVGKPVPDLALVSLDGEPFSTRDVDGALVVNFWASWCVPCRAEHAALVELAESHPEVTIVGIVYQDSEDAVNAFLDELGRAYPVVLDPGSRAAIAFGVRGVPETFFVDPNGSVVGKVNGPVDRTILESTLDQISAGSGSS